MGHTTRIVVALLVGLAVVSAQSALDPLDAAVQERPRGVSAAAVKLFDDLHQFQPLAPADALDALALQFW